MHKADLMKKLEKLEIENENLMSELIYIDYLMRMVGFVDGLKTVKITAREIKEKELHKHLDDEEL